jgi:2-dehydropantoate 2-reductase
LAADDASLGRIAILGAGAMGCFVGGCLATAGAAVVLLDVNEVHMAAIRDHGLHLTRDGLTRTIRLPVMRPADLDTAPDLLIVLTKQMHTLSALSAVRPHLLAQSWVLTLQNGLANRELIEHFVPAERILLGVTTYPADLSGPGQVASHGSGLVRLMTADGITRPITGQIVALFNTAGQDCVADPDLQVAIWEKVAFNAALNSICGVTGCLVGQVAAVPPALQLVHDMAAEVIAVAQRIGIAVNSARVHAAVDHALVAHAGHKPSMLQDLLAGRPTEIAAINGAVADAAARAGQPAPLTEALMALIRLCEFRRAAEQQ